jgi:hypothetical protein
VKRAAPRRSPASTRQDTNEAPDSRSDFRHGRSRRRPCRSRAVLAHSRVFQPQDASPGLPYHCESVRASCSCPNPESAPVLPTWIVNVDFAVSILCCWALTPNACTKNAAVRNTVRLTAHLKRNLQLKGLHAYCARYPRGSCRGMVNLLERHSLTFDSTVRNSCGH